jgi:tetratricopeptide (TPR) repeat protein/transcriptional regulator with XRE-family HTH domain
VALLAESSRVEGGRVAIRRPVGFGDLLHQHRKRAGLTQEQLAERAEMSVRGISDLERGVNRAPYRSTVARLADALELHGRDRVALEQASSRYGVNRDSVPLGRTFQQALPLTPLIGRDRELEMLGRHVRGELSPLLAIAGEPGIGKTRLLRAASDLADELGLPILTAGCQRVAGEQPYAPLGDALSVYVRGLPPARVRSVLKGCGLLSRLLPEISEMVRVPQLLADLTPETERRLLTGAVSRFLQNIASPQGALLLLDDLQWAGRDGLELLLALCRSAHETGVRIVSAYRATEITARDPLSTMLGDAAHAGLVQQIVLAPLSPEESGHLIDVLAPNQISPLGREQVLARSDGVPFFLVSCATVLLSGDARDEGIPWTVAHSVRQRVAALPDVAQELLAVGAVAGRIVPIGVITSVLEYPLPVIAAAIDAACQAGLLTEQDGRRYAFTHDVIREVVETDLGGARQMYFHLRVGEALERVPSGREGRQAAELAWHFGLGDDAARALHYSLIAGDHAASLYAHRDAADLYSAAARFASAGGDELAEAEACEKAGRELTMVAEYVAAVFVLDRAASLYRSIADIESEARVVAQLGWTHFYRATPNEAAARVESLVEQLRDRGPSASLGQLSITLTFLWYVDRPREALQAAARACRIAEALGDERLLAAARVRYGLVLGRTGRWDEGERVLAEVSVVAERIGDIESLTYALGFAGIACSMLGKLEESRAYCVRGVQVAEQFGDPTTVAYGLRLCGTIYFALGDWEQARVYYDRARAVDETTASSTFSALIPLQTMELVIAEGRWEEVDLLAAECLKREHDQRNDRIDSNFLCLLAERDLLQGRPRNALVRLEARLDDFYTDEIVNLGVRITPIEVCLTAGRLDRAETLLSQYTDLITKQGNRRAGPAMLRARGMVRAAQGRLREAKETFAEASDRASRMQYPLEHARILLVWARTERADGDRNQAEALAGEAECIFRRLGAAPYTAEARALLIDLRQMRAAGC